MVAVRQLTPDAYRRITFWAAVSLAAIVLTGATVRLTGSGLGCTDWPNCSQGRLTPGEISDAPAMIEFVNRLVTGVVSVAAILAVLGSLARQPRRRDLTLLSWGLVAGVVAQILLGALVVYLELWPPTVMGHFLLSMLIIWNAVVLHHRAGRPAAEVVPVVSDRVRSLLRAVFLATSVVVVTGTVVTAAGPHAGDEQAERLNIVVRDIARIHSIAVLATLVLVLVGVRWIWAEGSPPAVRRAAQVLVAVLVAQAAVGYAQYLTGVPVVLVFVHIAGALGVWVAAIHLNLVASAARVVERELVG